MIASGLVLLAVMASPVPIEGADRLGGFAAALTALDAGAARRVRVTHLGDSHVVADLWTGHVRASLQARFGDGGRGFVLPGRPWSSYWQRRLHNTAAGTWRVDGRSGGFDDGAFGPGGCTMASDSPDALVEMAVPEGADTAVEIHTLRQPAGGCFEVRIDGRPAGRISTRGPWPEADFARFDLPSGGSRVSVHPLVGGEVRIMGFDFIGERGLVYDALGINGARADRLLKVDPRQLADGLRRMSPDLLILSYGTNELFDADLDLRRYGERLDQVLTRLRRAVPTASCLLSGPPDALRRGRALPLIDGVIAAQRALAEAHGCAFWDTRAAMGGPGSIRTWRRSRWARGDFVHLTRDGYERLADLLATALMDAVLPSGPRPGIVAP